MIKNIFLILLIIFLTVLMFVSSTSIYFVQTSIIQKEIWAEWKLLRFEGDPSSQDFIKSESSYYIKRASIFEKISNVIFLLSVFSQAIFFILLNHQNSKENKRPFITLIISNILFDISIYLLSFLAVSLQGGGEKFTMLTFVAVPYFVLVNVISLIDFILVKRKLATTSKN